MWQRIIVSASILLFMLDPGRAIASPLEDLSRQLTSLVKAVTPAVVEIKSEVRTHAPGALTEDYDKAAKRTVTAVNVGTGFVVSPDGYILTTESIVGGAERVQVRFADGTTHDATLTGVDTVAQVAMIKVNQTGLNTLELGDSDALEPGAAVVMVNNQAGLANSVSLGIVAGIDRRVGSGLSDLIQISGTIGPGASGGPVIDPSGKVVAMTVAMLSPPEAYGQSNLEAALYSQYLEDWRNMKDIEGELATALRMFFPDHPEVKKLSIRLEAATKKVEDEKMEIQRLIDLAKPVTSRTSGSSGFAVPVSVIKPILDQLKSGQTVERAWLGASLSVRGTQMTLDPTPGGPADKSGIRPGDVLVSVDGRFFETPDDVLHYIADRKPGDSINLALRRGNENVEAHVKLGDRPASGKRG